MLFKVLQLTCLCYLLTVPRPSRAQGSCIIDGIGSSNWMFGFVNPIRDTDVGVAFSGATNVEYVPQSTIPFDFPLNNGPYLDFYLEDGKFVAFLMDNFNDFEEYETSTTMVNNIQLPCSSSLLTIEHRITDTNNHYPIFLDDNIEIPIITPMNAGIRIQYEIRVRDVDLTTTSIDFNIVGGSPLFEVVYERREGKTFYGALQTTSVITGLNEPLVLYISATDVDNTGDPPLTEYTTITIKSDPEFSLPPAPVFSQLFYSGSYSAESGLQVSGTIQLVEGYNEDVEFSLSGVYKDLFQLTVEAQVATLHVRDDIPQTILETYTNLVVVVLATNSMSSVTSAPVFIELPIPRVIRFERDHYIGGIYGTTLALEPIEVIEGFNDDLVFTLSGDMDEYFSFFIVANLVVVMNNHNPLPEDFVTNYDFLNLILEVTGPNTIRTIVGITLAVEGDDHITPLFTQAYYTGSYDPHDGLKMDQPIVLSQGFDNTVSIGLSGGASTFFSVTNTGSNINVVHSDIPPSVIEDNTNLLFYITANKPRTVGARATIHISLPQANILQFIQANFVGTFDGVELKLPVISLTENSYENLAFHLSGVHSAYFTETVVGNSVTIGAKDDFPDLVIEENDFIYLEIQATAFNSVPTSAVITLTVIKDDSTTPVFSSPVYTGNYDLVNGLSLDADIYLSQGFDNTVAFKKDEGDFNLLTMTTNLNSISLEVTDSIPLYVIEENSNLLFTISAIKEGTVGATAAVNIALPEASVLQFEYPSYTGRIWLAHEHFDVTLPPITLSKGFQDGITFSIQEGYQNYFEVTYNGDVVTIKATEQLQTSNADNFNDLINIVLTATGRNSIPATTVLSLEVITADTNTPVFTKAVYEGSYNSDTGLVTYEDIVLAQGFDETVSFSLSGDAVEYFEIQPNSHPVVIDVLNPISADFMRANSHILLSVTATKEWTVGASAILQVDFPTFDTDAIVLQFEEALYSGKIQEENIILAAIPLPSGYGADVALSLEGDHQEFFDFAQTNEAVEIYLATPLPDDVLESSTFINLVLHADGPTDDYISGFAVVVLEVDIRELIVPIFSQPFYLATYTPPSMIVINNGPISLLEETYDDELEFEMVGDFATYFSSQALGNFIIVSSTTPLPSDIITSNVFINLQMAVSGPNHQTVTVVISTTIATDNLVPPEFNAVHYTGTFQAVANTVSITGLIFLQPGFDPLVQFSIDGEFATYFTITSTTPSVTIARSDVEIPEQVLADNAFFTLILTASTSTISSSVIVTLAVDNGEIEIAFNAEYYTGIYNPTTGITLDNEISITSGFDANLQYSLTGEHAEYFTANPQSNPVIIAAPDGVPTSVLAENTFITLILTVSGPTHIPAFRTITLEMISDTLITPAFSDIFYTGILVAPNTVALNSPIDITAGFDETLQLVISGEFEQYFSATPVTNPATITVTSPLPSDVLTENTFLTLVLTATGPNHVPVTTTVTLEVADLITASFDLSYYTGLLTLPNNINLNTPIIVSEGFNDDLQFDVGGEFGTYFTASSSGTNSVDIIVSDDLPSGLLNEYTFITLVLTAQSSYHYSTTAIVTLEIADLITPQFDQLFYTGSLTVPYLIQLHSPITVSEGFDNSLEFAINGDFEAYFTPTASDGEVSVSLSNPLPNDIINENAYITLVLTAFGANHLTVTVTISLEIIIRTPVFDQIFYNGVLTLPNQISLENPIAVIDEFDDILTFIISGEFEDYFSATSSPDGTVTLQVDGVLPIDTITQNAFISLLVTASGPNHVSSTATINLEIADLITPVFDQVFYTGTLTIPNVIVLHSPITVSEGFDDSLQISIGEEFTEYFSATPNIADGTISIAVTGTIPNDILTENAYITLILIASGPNHITTRSTLSLEIIGLTTPVFDQIYYTGLLTLPEDISFNNPIIITEGFDETLNFDVGGEYGDYFTATGTAGTVSVVVSSQLPSETINTNAYITLTITAWGPNHHSVTTTLSLEVAELIVPVFDQLFYTGSLTPPTAIILDSLIIISSGFDETLQISINEEFDNYFTTALTGNSVTISVTEPLPIDVLNDNTFITLVLTASGTNHATVTTTVTIEIINLINPIFDQVFYIGTLRLPEEIVMDTPIQVVEGFDDTIQFIPSGEFGEYFSATSSPDGVITLAVSTDLPSDTVNENTFITLVLTASGPNHVTVTTTITLEIAELITPIFDLVFYTGTLTIPNTIVLHSPITISEGFDNTLDITVDEEFENFFSASPNAADGTIAIAVTAALPNEILDDNTYITLILTASGPNHVTTRTTLSLELIGLTTPVFNQIYYTGLLTLPETIAFNNPILITEGFDETLSFEVGGEYGTYFTATATEGNVNVIVSSQLPSETINTNAFITLTITAAGPNHQTVTTTLSLEIAELILPVFDQLFYTGSLTPPTAIALDSPIIISSGFDDTLQISINEEFNNYFTTTITENTIGISVTQPLPIDVLNDNTFITLVLTAFGTNHATVTTTVTIEIVNLITPVFDQLIYVGSLRLPEEITMNTPIQVVEGFDETIQFIPSGEFGEYFSATSSAEGIITLDVSNDLPSDTINENTFITLVLTASGPNHVTVTTTITLEIAELITPVFDQVFYTGTLTIPNSIVLDNPITISEGFDETLGISIGEEYDDYFSATPNVADGTINIAVTAALPNEILDENTYITLILTASGPNHVTTRTTLSLELIGLTTPVFNQIYYTGLLTLPETIAFNSPILITEGFDDTLSFEVGGEYGTYFTSTATEGTVNVIVSSELPSETINANAFITLTITATGPNHQTVTTTLSLEIAELIVPVFDQLFYTGSLTPPTAIALDSPIIISSGFDDTLQISINEEFNDYFTIAITENTIGISVTQPLPIDVLNDNTFITLVLTAFGTNHATVTTTVTIEIVNLITPVFDQIFYIGTLRLPEEIIMDTSILVTEGFDETIQFVPSGEFGDYFSASSSLDGIVTLTVSNDLPSETVNENTFITLVLTASGPNHVTVTTTITLEIAELITPVFDQIFYTGSLTLPDTIVLHNPIIVSEGFDDTLLFSIGEEFVDYFSVASNEDGTISIAVTTALPNEILDLNTYITLVLIASGSNHVTVRTTLSLELIGLTTPVFDQVFYTGVLNLPDVVTLDSPIIISDGFDTSLQVLVEGEYGEYFSASATEAGSVTVVVSGELPTETISANAFITLIITVSGPNHLTTINTLTLEITDLIWPQFDQIFYVGTLTMPDVIELDSPIIVSEGFDDSLQFSIGEEFENYFTAAPTTNGATITVSNPLPNEVLTENLFITLTLTAFGPNHAAITTTVTLEILDLVVPVFNQIYYTGVLSRSGITLHNPIIVSEGFDDTLGFTVEGEYGDDFDATSDNGEVTIIIVNDLPSETFDEYAYITLVLAASGPNHRTVLTTVSLELVPLIVPTFSELFYTGVHSPNGIQLNSPIIVTSELTETLEFSIVGEFEGYFTAAAEGTQVNIEISTPLPSEVIYTNAFVTLVLAAFGPNHNPSNVIITLEIVTEVAIVTQFEELYYTGLYNYPIGVELTSNIILTQGFDDTVTFNLAGDYASYFSTSPASNPVTITATEVLPNEVVVENAFISLILTAIGPTHIPTTTIVTLEIVLLDEIPPAFDQVFYEGTYTSPGQLDFQDPIALNQGFDENVIFDISGEQSELFSITVNTNPAVITSSDPIPQQVIEDYTNLIFVVTATKPGTASASATIRVNLPPVLVNVLRFEHDAYVGYLQDDILNLESIVLAEGYNGAIAYDLQGDFSDHFVFSIESHEVTILLQVPLPEEIVQQATFINIVLEASTTGYSVATTTAITISINPIQTSVPVFLQTSYTGEYSVADGLHFDNEINLSQGFDETVSFYLSGDQSTSFTLTTSGNLAQISVEVPIPAAIIAQNNHLLFSVNAVKEGTPGASSAVLIQLLEGDDDVDPIEPTTLEFSQNSYTFTATSNQLGFIGSVTATANTGEIISYSLETDNVHLTQRLQIGSTNGQIILTNYVNTGLYQVTVTATTIHSAVSAIVPLSLRVDSIFICNNNNFLLDPLIIIEQVEEQAFSDIVILNEELAGTCTYEITDTWPSDQPWFGIVNNNLASTAVDREDPSIAFMTLSQVQIELSLNCGPAQNALLSSANNSRYRRSAPYNLDNDENNGERTWLLSDEIKYTLERRVVNVVILDINDNSPIFDGSENEPVVVGYPDANTLHFVTPPYLTQVHATDADIGINAHIRYSLTDTRFSIHPDTGVVYLMPNAMETLADGVFLDVYATDEYGLGNVGELNLQIRLLNVQHIAVLIINNAFLESQDAIRLELENILNYRIKILSARVSPDLNPVEEEAEEEDEEDPEEEPEEGPEEGPEEEPEEGPEDPEEVRFIRPKGNNVANRNARNIEEAPLLTLYIYAVNDESALISANTLVQELRNEESDDFSWTIVSQTLADYTHESFWTGLVITIFVLSGVLLLIFLTFVGVVWFRIRQNRYKKFKEDGSVDSDKTTSRTSNAIILPKTTTNLPSPTQIYTPSTQSGLVSAINSEPRVALGATPTVVVTDETGIKRKKTATEKSADKNQQDEGNTYFKFKEEGPDESTSL